MAVRGLSIAFVFDTCSTDDASQKSDVDEFYASSIVRER
jgi:hypothetical protein